MQRVLGLESAETARALLLSWVGGYAVCARLAGQLYGAGGALRGGMLHFLQVLGCCSGPGFVIGCVGGGPAGNVRLGVVLYAAQIGEFGGRSGLSAAIPHCRGEHCSPAGLFRWDSLSGKKHSHTNLTGEQHSPLQTAPGRFRGAARFSLPPAAEEASSQRGPKGLPQAISSAVTSSLSVCGCVVFFRIVGAVLLAVLPLPPTAVSAALEVSAGCADFAALGGAAALYGCCACLSVLGVSVWAQLRLFAGAAAYRPRLLLFSAARCTLYFCSCSSGCVHSCCPAALRHAVRWPPASCRFSVCRRTPRQRVCLSLRGPLQGLAKPL